MADLNDRLVALARAIAVGDFTKRNQLVAFELVKEYDQQTHQEEQNAPADLPEWDYKNGDES